MTAQINDRFRHCGAEYSLAGISEGELFDPSILDLKPAMASTACWRGYQAIFAVLDSRLVLDTLHVNLPEGEREECRSVQGPAINGVAPTGSREGFDFFNNHYEGLDYYLEYSGGLLIADGFIYDLYVHMGFHPPWKYKTVIELVFEDGVLRKEFDRSERMAKVRQLMLDFPKDDGDRRIPNRDEIQQFVERAFDRSYHM
jgi:hypothetical protein